MNIVKIILFIVLGVAVAFWWNGQRTAVKKAPENSPQQDYAAKNEGPAGFVPVVMPRDAKPDTVLILAPIKCSSSASKRADALAKDLTRLNIPNERSGTCSLDMKDQSPEEQAKMESAMKIMNGEPPVVFVNGMGMSNPSLDMVVAAYRKGK